MSLFSFTVPNFLTENHNASINVVRQRVTIDTLHCVTWTSGLRWLKHNDVFKINYDLQMSLAFRALVESNEARLER